MSGILRAGPVDVEVLRIGAHPPPGPVAYGIGMVSDRPLRETAAALRAMGLATSPAVRGSAGAGEERRIWWAAQVKGLLPDPFPAPSSTRRPGALDRLLEAGSGAAGRVPFLAKAATRRAGASMVVLTEYGFDVAAWRASAGGGGPRVVAVHVGAVGRRAAWERLPLARDGEEDVAVHLDDDGPAGLTRIVLAGEASGPPASFALGEIALEFRRP